MKREYPSISINTILVDAQKGATYPSAVKDAMHLSLDMGTDVILTFNDKKTTIEYYKLLGVSGSEWK